MQEIWVRSLGRDDSLEKEMETHSSILSQRIPWAEEPGTPVHGVTRVGHDLGSITNKASEVDGIPVELFQILKDDSVKVLPSVCQQIWKTQQWPQDWKKSVFIPIPKKGNAKECSNYHTIALISYASKVMLNIRQARLHQYVN